ncbi:MAG: aminotransferase class I/II-fold pyridoxal phosphate-dependent enzyme [Candidatus Aenigmarchaeota archaeon]|nr:aminotransferase class I/II-fold pyridoxal phosphate-dependent enzyme [Candidatus Aenigmarchaeota archaeon]
MKRELKLTKRVKNIQYAIRDVILPAKKLAARGKKLYYFNIGDPNKFDFDTPLFLKNAMKKVMNEKSGYYSVSEGEKKILKLIAKKESTASVKLKPSDCIFTQGISEGINFLMASIMGKGKEILISSPAYPVFYQSAKFYDGEPVLYKTSEEDDWQPDIDDLRKKINKRTAGIVVINPNNPTGSVYSKKILKKIVDISCEFDLPIISDEIYRELVFDEKSTPILSIAKDADIILFNGFSKAFLIPGWRAGYACFYGSEKIQKIKEGFLKLARIRLCTCTPVQLALAKILSNISALTNSKPNQKPSAHILKNIIKTNKKLKKRAEFAFRKLNSIPGITAVKPKGAFYIFPKVDLKAGGWKNDKEFVLDVLKNTGLVLVHGSGFDPSIKAHFRSVILPPVKIMDEAFSKLERFMKRKIK